MNSLYIENAWILMSEDKEELKKLIDWMKENVDPFARTLNAVAEQETKEIYVGTNKFLAATLIGVFIGVLTNISADFLMIGNAFLGFVFILLSIFITLFSFYLWRFYLIKDLKKQITESFYEKGRLMKKKFEEDSGISSEEAS